MSGLTPEQQRRQRFHRLQNQRAGVDPKARPMVGSNALSYWFATGQVLEGLTADERSVIAEIERGSAEKRSLHGAIKAALVVNARLGGAHKSRALLFAEADELAARIEEAVKAHLGLGS